MKTFFSDEKFAFFCWQLNVESKTSTLDPQEAQSILTAFQAALKWLQQLHARYLNLMKAAEELKAADARRSFGLNTFTLDCTTPTNEPLCAHIKSVNCTYINGQPGDVLKKVMYTDKSYNVYSLHLDDVEIASGANLMIGTVNGDIPANAFLRSSANESVSDSPS